MCEARGAFADARSYYEEALTLCRESGNRRGEAYVLTVIGETFRFMGESERACQLYLDAVAIAREIGADYLEGLLLGNLAYTHAAAGELDKAEATGREVLQRYQRGGSVATLLPAIISAAEVLHRRGESARALEPLGLARAHPANRQDHTSEIERVLAVIASTVSRQKLARHLKLGAELNLGDEIKKLFEAGALCRS